MLKNCNFKINYTSEEDNLYKDFYLRALTHAINYDRAVGYFSISVLLKAPAALSQLVERNGRIRIIFSKVVSEQDLDQIRQGYEYDFESTTPSFMQLLESHKGTLIEYRIKLLAYLLRTGKLEIKVALRRSGMFHQKIGIMQDASGDRIAFNGSMNETASAFDPEINSEEITIFKSWLPDQLVYLDKYAADFEKLWENRSSDNTIVCDLPSVIKDHLRIISADDTFSPSVEKESALFEKFYYNQKRFRSGPVLPEHINGNLFSIRDHQKLALNAWKDAGFRGILELATGTGKTITAIYALTKIAESMQGVVAIVSVPYVDLAEQWVDELRIFNIFALKCYGSQQNWRSKLNDYLRRNQVSQTEFLAIVVVNKTLKTDGFKDAMSNLDKDKLVFIGDECHHHMGESYVDFLPMDAGYKIGLSATPFHYMDPLANDRLRSFYGDVVYKYSLYEAIENGILTQYEYYPVPVTLTFDECDEYFELSEKIGRIIAATGGKGVDGDQRLSALLMRRARLIGTASNKLVALKSLIAEQGVKKHSLFYCSDGKVTDEDDTSDDLTGIDDVEVKQRYVVGRLLRENGVAASFFTADETRTQRMQILEDFKSGEIDALVAIKCLDEGIDVPACSTAYILASSRNPRQFIQRRGRILRRFPGKSKAIIYDFVVVLPPGSIEHEQKESDFFKGELLRVADFAKHSMNPLSSLRELEYWLDRYDLHHLVV
jgi:superfamily II DNA or RNA helicase